MATSCHSVASSAGHFEKSGNKQATCCRFVAASPRIEDSLGGIASGDWKGPIPRISIWTFVAIKIKDLVEEPRTNAYKGDLPKRDDVEIGKLIAVQRTVLLLEPFY